jgi:hypothetical protein
MSRILVCGGRSYADFTSVSKALVNIHLSIGILFLIHGGVSGADALANTWAVKYGVPVKSYPPNWEAHGERAVGVRNALMIADGKPHLVVAFPGGPGTVDLLEKVAVAGLPVWRPAEETLKDVVGRGADRFPSHLAAFVEGEASAPQNGQGEHRTWTKPDSGDPLRTLPDRRRGSRRI